jgi:hypothetical protein
MANGIQSVSRFVLCLHYGSIAQSGSEHLPYKQGAKVYGGSNPSTSTAEDSSSILDESSVYVCSLIYMNRSSIGRAPTSLLSEGNINVINNSGINMAFAT